MLLRRATDDRADRGVVLRILLAATGASATLVRYLAGVESAADGAAGARATAAVSRIYLRLRP